MNIMTTQTATIVAETQKITRHFQTKGGEVQALRGIDLRISRGEMVALQGRSGSGKTTLLNILAGLDNPTSGQVFITGQALASLSEDARADLRCERMGILFQNAHLFPLLTAQENVELMLRLGRVGRSERRARAQEALEQVELTTRAHHRALELSGGEQQRVALARALVHRPQFLLADEPTGNLDLRTGQEISELLREMSHQHHIGLLIATHDANIAEISDRVYHLHDGKFIE
jgi:ABC-type lipoprotein export system ATPase subunit